MDMNRLFSALVVSEDTNGQFRRTIVQRRIGDLPDHEVLVRVRYSSLNYKDALSATGNRGVTRRAAACARPASLTGGGCRPCAAWNC